MKKVVHAACPHDCPDACGVLITVDELSGRAVKIQGDPSHPVTRGFLCAKVAKYIDRVYSPDRLLYPMRRVQPKGNANFGPGAFERISWDEAFAAVSAKIRSIADEFGPEAILPYSYGGTLGLLNNASMDHRFFHLLGASQLDRTICATAGGDALISVLGRKMGTEPEQFRKSKYIIAWGANIHGNNVHLWPFIEEARRNGAKLVVIDPYRTRTARVADWHIAINPGTDVALALSLMRVIIQENLHDADYVAKHTLGFDELRKRVNEDIYAPESVAGITGIPAANIIKLAREYATARPAVIRLNYGIQRSENGGMAARAVTMLPCITGSWKEVGGGLQLSTSGSFLINDKSLTRPDLMLKSPLRRPARTINMSELGKVLTTLTDANKDAPPVKMVFVYNSNPAAVAPNNNDVLRGFLRPDLFTVVHDQFFTDTTDYADIVLPATTFFEHKELQKSYGHYYLQISTQAIAPLGEARSNVDMFRGLALHMGLDQQDDSFRESVDQMIDGALHTDSPFFKGITRERLEREPHIRLNLHGNGTHGDAESHPFLPFAQGGFPTPSGKAELYSAALAAQGLDPVASFLAPRESRHNTQRAAEFPLELLARKADNHLNTTFCNLPGHQKMEESHLLELSPADANPRGIKDGDEVRIFNSRGEVRLTARVDGAVRAGVVAAKLNWSRLAPDQKSINVLTSETLTEIGRGATFYSCLVEVERA
ncbi:MAG: molybdopterin-dependent oxidoreductase [Terriglobales bacterium]